MGFNNIFDKMDTLSKFGSAWSAVSKFELPTSAASKFVTSDVLGTSPISKLQSSLNDALSSGRSLSINTSTISAINNASKLGGLGTSDSLSHDGMSYENITKTAQAIENVLGGFTTSNFIFPLKDSFEWSGVGKLNGLSNIPTLPNDTSKRFLDKISTLNFNSALSAFSTRVETDHSNYITGHGVLNSNPLSTFANITSLPFNGSPYKVTGTAFIDSNLAVEPLQRIFANVGQLSLENSVGFAVMEKVKGSINFAEQWSNIFGQFHGKDSAFSFHSALSTFSSKLLDFGVAQIVDCKPIGMATWAASLVENPFDKILKNNWTIPIIESPITNAIGRFNTAFSFQKPLQSSIENLYPFHGTVPSSTEKGHEHFAETFNGEKIAMRVLKEINKNLFSGTDSEIVVTENVDGNQVHIHLHVNINITGNYNLVGYNNTLNIKS